MPAKTFACIRVTIFYTLYESGFLTQGARNDEACIGVYRIQDICHFSFQGYRILPILLPGIWDTWFNIFVTTKDIENLGKLWGYLPIYKGYLPVNFKGYGIFGTPPPPPPPLYKPQWCSTAQKNRAKAHKILFLQNKE